MEWFNAAGILDLFPERPSLERHAQRDQVRPPLRSLVRGAGHLPLNGSNNSTSNLWKSRTFPVTTVSR